MRSVCSLRSGRGICPFTTFLGSPLAGRHTTELHSEHDQILKLVVTIFPWATLLYTRADREAEGIDLEYVECVRTAFEKQLGERRTHP